MLKTVEFIQKHNNWEELLSAAPYSLKITHDGRYVILSYNMIESDFHQPICSEARGLILDSEDNYKPVRMAFTKFFNIDEPFAATIDWKTASASEKIDGSIMSVWYHDNEWHVSTNNTIDAQKAEINHGASNFREVFDVAAANSGLDFDKLNKNYCYTFELISPKTTVVIKYKETKLYHLLTRDMTTLAEVSEDIGVEKPTKYPLTDEASIRKIVDDFDEGHEGVVVVDGNFNRVKIKTKTYFLMHHLCTNMCLTNAIELIRMNDYEEFISYFKEYTDFFHALDWTYHQIIRDAKKLDGLMLYLHDSYECLYQASKYREDIVKKRFINAISKLPSNFASRVLLAYDGNLLNTLMRADTNRFIRATRQYWLKLANCFSEYISVEDINAI